MKHFLIKYRFQTGSQVDWHKDIAAFIAAIDSDPALKGRPEGFVLPVTDVRAAAGAGFVYPLAGNIMTMPDGRTRWGLTGSIRYRGNAPLRQMQLIQHGLTELEARYTADAVFGPEDAAALVAAVYDATDPAFAVRLTYVAGRLDNERTGKFEEFISRIP